MALARAGMADRSDPTSVWTIGTRPGVTTASARGSGMDPRRDRRVDRSLSFVKTCSVRGCVSVPGCELAPPNVCLIARLCCAAPSSRSAACCRDLRGGRPRQRHERHRPRAAGEPAWGSRAAGIRLGRGSAGPAVRTSLPAHASSASRVAGRGSYGWPMKPFERQHPIRAFFGDPRAAGLPRGRRRDLGAFSFHNSMEHAVLSAPLAEPQRGCVVTTHAGLQLRVFQYWHLESLVRLHQRVQAQRTVLGTGGRPSSV